MGQGVKDSVRLPLTTHMFAVLGDAQKELLDDGKRENLLRLFEMARGGRGDRAAQLVFSLLAYCLLATALADEIRKERKKQTKNDNAVRLASMLHEVCCHDGTWHTRFAKATTLQVFL